MVVDLTKIDLARGIIQVLRKLPALPEPDIASVTILCRRSTHDTLLRQHTCLVKGG